MVKINRKLSWQKCKRKSVIVRLEGEKVSQTLFCSSLCRRSNWPQRTRLTSFKVFGIVRAILRLSAASPLSWPTMPVTQLLTWLPRTQRVPWETTVRNSPAGGTTSTTTTANSGRHPIQSYCHDSRTLARPLNHNTFPWSFAPLRQQVLPPTANYMQMNWPNLRKKVLWLQISKKKKKNAATRKVEKRKQQIANCGPVLTAEGEWIHQGRRRKINVCRRYRYSYSTIELLLEKLSSACKSAENLNSIKKNS